jgi:hypothetical protein
MKIQDKCVCVCVENAHTKRRERPLLSKEGTIHGI